MDMPTLEELLKAGAHFGHAQTKRHPNMDRFLFGVRNGVHIIDLEQTLERLRVACDSARELSRNGKVILFVGTKDQAAPIVRAAALRVAMPYVVGRWLGGTITNFAVISKLIQKYRALVRSRDTGELEQKYTKHEQSAITREIARLEVAVGGIAEINKIPDALFVVDVRDEETAVREARRKRVPIFAICDSNVDPEHITYPIPGNDDAVASLRIIVETFTAAIAEGITERARSDAQEVAASSRTEETSTQPATAIAAEDIDTDEDRAVA